MKNRKTICFFSYWAYYLFNPKGSEFQGGAEVDLYCLAKRFAQTKEYNVTFYVGDFGQNDQEEYDGIKVCKYKYIEAKGINTIFHKLVRKIKFVIFTFSLKGDVFITEGASKLVGWFALSNRIFNKKNTIYRLAIDDDADLEIIRNKYPKIYKIYKYGLFNSDKVISQTVKQQDMLNRNYSISSVVIKNALFIENTQQNQQKDYILWVGRAVAVKRPQLFLELAKKLPNAKFVMIMPFHHSSQESKNLSDSLKQEELKLSNLEIIDYVPFKEIQKYYDNAKIFVNTSELEGFPNAFVQACIGHTPILSFQINPDDFIGKNKLGFYCNDDSEAAVQFIENFTQNDLFEYGENAFKYVKKYHDIDNIYPIYKGIIDKLTKNKGEN